MTTATSWETRHIRQEYFDLFNEMGAQYAAQQGYHDMHEAAQQAVINDFADNLRGMIEDLEMPATPFAQGVMHEFLREVDWYVLAEEFIQVERQLPEPQQVTPMTMTLTKAQAEQIMRAIEHASIVLQSHTEYDNPSDEPSAESEALNNLSEVWAVLKQQMQPGIPSCAKALA